MKLVDLTVLLLVCVCCESANVSDVANIVGDDVTFATRAAVRRTDDDVRSLPTQSILVAGKEWKNGVCKRPAKCRLLETTKCFGYNLPYKSTSTSLVGDDADRIDVEKELQKWQVLQKVPRCWSVIQPLLCAIYVPKCENDTVELPHRDLCKASRNPCRFVETIDEWPPFLRCENEIFRTSCKNEWREAKFNSSTECPVPLIETDSTVSWVDGIEGCGVPCQNPLFSSEEHNHIRTLVTIIGSISLSCCLFTVTTFIIDWQNASRYPALGIFFMNVCFLIVNIGWLAQLMPDAKNDIICKKDGTLRLEEPS